MNSKVTTDKTIDPSNPRGASRPKMWLIFGVLFVIGVAFYGSTIYRIQNHGYTGIGEDQLAHPEDAAPAVAPAAAPQK